MQGDVLVVSPSRGSSCCEAVRAFLCPMGRSVRAVEAKLAKADGVVFTSELWTVGSCELSGIAEEIATWIAAESSEPRDLEAVIMIRGERREDG
jgi:hypothetical protein